MKRHSALLAFAIILLAGSTAAGAGEAASPPVLAKQLATKVSTARGTAARYRAVLEVMKALHAPVFTASGKQLAPGAKGLPRGYNLYDFQLRAVASSLTRTISLEDFARLLSSGGKPVSATTLRTVLQRGIRAAAARSSTPSSTVGLVVRELGLRHRPASALTRDVPVDQPVLDPLQTMLVIADTAVRTGSARYRTTAGRSGANTSPCEETATPLTRLLGAAGAPIGPTLPFWKLISLNQQLMAATKVTPLAGVRETHYGPPGHAPFAGRRLKFAIHAENTQDFPDDIKCGYFAGAAATLPPKGPLKGVPVSWSADGGFDKHFTSVKQDEKTDARGNAVVELDVRNEAVPGFGRVLRRQGVVTARVTPGLRTEPVAFAQTWAVEYHLPRGFKYSGSYSFTNTAADGSQITFLYTFTGSICGADPYEGLWKLDLRQDASIGIPVQRSISFNILKGSPTTVDFGAGITATVDLRLDQRRTRVTFTPPTAGGGSWTPTSFTGEVPLVEDTSCPDNS